MIRAAACALLYAICAVQPEQASTLAQNVFIPPFQLSGSDGHQFESKEFTKLRFIVEVAEYKSQEDLEAAFKKRGNTIPPRYKLAAFSTPGITCKVHIMDPEVSYQPESLGHEAFHCIHGSWHPKYTLNAEKLHGDLPSPGASVRGEDGNPRPDHGAVPQPVPGPPSGGTTPK